MPIFFKRRGKNRRTKAAQQAKHASRRFSERFGERLKKHMLDEIVAMIQGGKSKLVERQSARISLHELTYRDERMRVVYDKTRNQIVTFMRKEEDRAEARFDER